MQGRAPIGMGSPYGLDEGLLGSSPTLVGPMRAQSAGREAPGGEGPGPASLGRGGPQQAGFTGAAGEGLFGPATEAKARTLPGSLLVITGTDIPGGTDPQAASRALATPGAAELMTTRLRSRLRSEQPLPLLLEGTACHLLTDPFVLLAEGGDEVAPEAGPGPSGGRAFEANIVSITVMLRCPFILVGHVNPADVRAVLWSDAEGRALPVLSQDWGYADERTLSSTVRFPVPRTLGAVSVRAGVEGPGGILYGVFHGEASLPVVDSEAVMADLEAFPSLAATLANQLVFLKSHAAAGGAGATDPSLRDALELWWALSVGLQRAAISHRLHSLAEFVEKSCAEPMAKILREPWPLAPWFPPTLDGDRGDGDGAAAGFVRHGDAEAEPGPDSVGAAVAVSEGGRRGRGDGGGFLDGADMGGFGGGFFGAGAAGGQQMVMQSAPSNSESGGGSLTGPMARSPGASAPPAPQLPAAPVLHQASNGRGALAASLDHIPGGGGGSGGGGAGGGPKYQPFGRGAAAALRAAAVPPPPPLAFPEDGPLQEVSGLQRRASPVESARLHHPPSAPPGGAFAIREGLGAGPGVPGPYAAFRMRAREQLGLGGADAGPPDDDHRSPIMPAAQARARGNGSVGGAGGAAGGGAASGSQGEEEGARGRGGGGAEGAVFPPLPSPSVLPWVSSLVARFFGPRIAAPWPVRVLGMSILAAMPMVAPVAAAGAGPAAGAAVIMVMAGGGLVALVIENDLSRHRRRTIGLHTVILYLFAAAYLGLHLVPASLAVCAAPRASLSDSVVHALATCVGLHAIADASLAASVADSEAERWAIFLLRAGWAGGAALCSTDCMASGRAWLVLLAAFISLGFRGALHLTTLWLL